MEETVVGDDRRGFVFGGIRSTSVYSEIQTHRGLSLKLGITRGRGSVRATNARADVTIC